MISLSSRGEVKYLFRCIITIDLTIFFSRSPSLNVNSFEHYSILIKSAKMNFSTLIIIRGENCRNVSITYF